MTPATRKGGIVLKLSDFMSVPTDGAEVLGQVAYYSLSSILVQKNILAELCQGVGLEYKPGARPPIADAFRSATGDVHKRIVTRKGNDTEICKVYFRDNESTAGYLTRELIKETLDSRTNQYTKLANVRVGKKSGEFEVMDLAYDPHVDAKSYCEQANSLFLLYQACASRRQVEGLLDKFLTRLDAVKICRGKFFFVPRHSMQRLPIFEDFAASLSENNLITAHRSPEDPEGADAVPSVDTNTMFVVDDQKQRNKMANAFYDAVGKEIEEYEERIQHLLQSGCTSAKIADRWMKRVDSLTEKKRRYENVLQRQLDKTKDDFEDLRFMADRLQLQTRKSKQPQVLDGQTVLPEAA